MRALAAQRSLANVCAPVPSCIFEAGGHHDRVARGEPDGNKPVCVIKAEDAERLDQRINSLEKSQHPLREVQILALPPAEHDARHRFCCRRLLFLGLGLLYDDR